MLFCGDVVGKPGRNAVTRYIPELRKKLELDFVVVCGENAASGFGITKKICNGFLESGVDVITTGDHVFDQKETIFFIDDYKELLRPANLPERLPGAGFRIFKAKGGKKVLVIQLLAQLFVKMMPDNPFECVQAILEKHKMGKDIDAIMVDFHGEATSERMAMGHFLDGRVSLVTGSHTHVPTGDMQILPGKTAYHTDAGMCGDYDSVIGFDKEVSVPEFVNKIRSAKRQVATGEGTLCGTFVETNDKTGLAKSISAVRIGGRLQEILPNVAEL